MAFDFSAFVPHTKSFEHQSECLARSYNKRAFAYVIDPGLGKSKIVLDNTTILWDGGFITGLLILSYNDVHAQWIEEQIPAHWPPRIKLRTFIWDAGAPWRMKLSLIHI